MIYIVISVPEQLSLSAKTNSSSPNTAVWVERALHLEVQEAKHLEVTWGGNV